MSKAVIGAVDVAVFRAVFRAVRGAVRTVVDEAVYGAVDANTPIRVETLDLLRSMRCDS